MMLAAPGSAHSLRAKPYYCFCESPREGFYKSFSQYPRKWFPKFGRASVQIPTASAKALGRPGYPRGACGRQRNPKPTGGLHSPPPKRYQKMNYHKSTLNYLKRHRFSNPNTVGGRGGTEHMYKHPVDQVALRQRGL